jgi:hypothetical protein
MCLEAFAVAAAARAVDCACKRGINPDRFDPDRNRFNRNRFDGRGVSPELFRRGIEPTMNIHRCTCCDCRRHHHECCRPCCD